MGRNLTGMERAGKVFSSSFDDDDEKYPYISKSKPITKL